jgi:hypothetical protein
MSRLIQRFFYVDNTDPLHPRSTWHAPASVHFNDIPENYGNNTTNTPAQAPVEEPKPADAKPAASGEEEGSAPPRLSWEERWGVSLSEREKEKRKKLEMKHAKKPSTAEGQGEKRGWSRWVFGGVGAVLGAIAGSFAMKEWDKGKIVGFFFSLLD